MKNVKHFVPLSVDLYVAKTARSRAATRSPSGLFSNFDVLFRTKYLDTRKIGTTILEFSIGRGHNNLNAVFIFVSNEEKTFIVSFL